MSIGINPADSTIANRTAIRLMTISTAGAEEWLPPVAPSEALSRAGTAHPSSIPDDSKATEIPVHRLSWWTGLLVIRRGRLWTF
jgi:hypothetical protein